MSKYAHYEALKVEVKDKIAVATLNRPPYNAMNRTLIHEIHNVWADLTDDDDVHAIVLTGAGDYFSVGGDVKQMSERPGGDFLHEGEAPYRSRSRDMVHDILNCDKPTISAINGACAGLAATAALFCDISVMAEDAKILDPHARVGLVAGDGGAIIWPMLIGPNRAKEYLMRGKAITGAEAERIGLVNYAKPKSEVLPTAMELARELADGPTWAVRWTKLCVNKSIKDQVNLVLDAGHALERITMTMEDHAEASRAFKEKRKGKYKGL
jgi:enoyl-CoA hydratase/carnithine racemase